MTNQNHKVLSDSIRIFILYSVVVISSKLIFEKSLATHMLVTIPLLIYIGALIGYTFPCQKFNRTWNKNGVNGMLIAAFTMLFWMLPKTLDLSLDTSIYASAKYITLPFLCGTMLTWSWKRCSFLAKNFFQFEFLATIFRFSWLYLTSKSRLCVNYLYDEQQYVGYGLLAFATIHFMFLVYYLFNKDFRHPETNTIGSRNL